MCGQRRIRPEDLSARRFFRESFEELADLRVKFKILRTLRGLLIPGWLTAEYLAGRRQSCAGQGIGLPPSVVAAAGYAVLAPYLFLALKRVYRGANGVLLWKTGVLLIFIVILNRVSNDVAIRLTLALA